jgi:hypothetical protein
MFKDQEIDYLVLTSIDDDQEWDHFAFWLATNVKNVNDYNMLIRNRPIDGPALRNDDEWGLSTAHWEYRAGSLSFTHVWGYSIDEEWKSSPRLDSI